jgi:hypothetical protein
MRKKLSLKGSLVVLGGLIAALAVAGQATAARADDDPKPADPPPADPAPAPNPAPDPGN